MEEREKGAEFTASEEEVEDALEDAAEELGQPVEKVRENVESMMGGDDDPATGFNESVTGASFAYDEVGEDDPRLEAIELYKLRQRI
ncbi:MAG: hypothetical protein ACOCT0_05085 [Halobacteriota archaeon]